MWLIASALFFASCGDDTDDTEGANPPVIDADRHFTAENIKFTPAGETTLPMLEITLSGAEAAGEEASMVLVFDAKPDAEGDIILPSGKYDFNASQDRDKTLLDTEASKFTVVGKDGAASGERITGGSVTVSRSNGKYRFEGNLSGAATAEYEFTYGGRFVIRDPNHTGGNLITARFDDYRLGYDNKFIKKGIYTHYLTLVNEAGDRLCAEFFSEPDVDFSYMANGTYTLTNISNQGEAQTLNNSDSTYYYSASQDRSYIFTELEITTGFDVTDGYHAIKAKGVLETGQEFETVFETELGQLYATKVYLGLEEMAFKVLGQTNAYTVYAYYLMLDSYGDSQKAKEEVYLYSQGPINRYYKYLPIPTGHYISPPVEEGWSSDRDSFKPFRLLSDVILSENGVKFTNNKGSATWLLIETGDASYLDLECATAPGGYAFKLNGVLQAFKADDSGDDRSRDPEWPAIEVHFNYNGVVADAEEYHRHVHPWSTATTSRDFTDYFTEAIYWRPANHYWDFYGAPAGTGFVLLTLKNDEGEWDSWGEGGSNNIFYMHIGLNIDPSTPEDEIPVGTYTCDDGYTFQAGTFMQGARWGWDNIFSCTMIFNESLTQDYPFGYGKDGGTITISRDGDEYTIVWDCYDDKGPNANRMTGKYVGEIWEEY